MTVVAWWRRTRRFSAALSYSARKVARPESQVSRHICRSEARASSCSEGMWQHFSISFMLSLKRCFWPPGWWRRPESSSPYRIRRGRRLDCVRITCPVQRSCRCISISSRGLLLVLRRISVRVTLCHQWSSRMRCKLEMWKTPWLLCGDDMMSIQTHSRIEIQTALYTATLVCIVRLWLRSTLWERRPRADEASLIRCCISSVRSQSIRYNIAEVSETRGVRNRDSAAIVNDDVVTDWAESKWDTISVFYVLTTVI